LAITRFDFIALACCWPFWSTSSPSHKWKWKSNCPKSLLRLLHTDAGRKNSYKRLLYPKFTAYSREKSVL